MDTPGSKIAPQFEKSISSLALSGNANALHDFK
jgi:hypothetical protein